VLIPAKESDAEEDIENSLEVDDEDLPIEAFVCEANVVKAILHDDAFVIQFVFVLPQLEKDEDREAEDPDQKGGESIDHDG